LVRVATEEEVLEHTGAFLQLYREEAHYFERTAPWIAPVGIAYVKKRLVEDPRAGASFMRASCIPRPSCRRIPGPSGRRAWTPTNSPACRRSWRRDMDLVWKNIGPLDNIPVQGARRLCFGHRGRPIAVFRTGEDGIFALIDECPHRHLLLLLRQRGRHPQRDSHKEAHKPRGDRHRSPRGHELRVLRSRTQEAAGRRRPALRGGVR
jgi:hypothetical protein